MGRVEISVAGHKVEVDSDVDLSTLVTKALYLFERTAAQARSSTVGFGTTALVAEIVVPEESS